MYEDFFPFTFIVLVVVICISLFFYQNFHPLVQWLMFVLSGRKWGLTKNKKKEVERKIHNKLYAGC